MSKWVFLLSSLSFLLLMIMGNGCKPDDPTPPEIQILFSEGDAGNGDTLAVGRPFRVTISATGIDASITNFLIEKVYNGTRKPVLDSGLNSSGFTVTKTFYQGIEENVEWCFTVMDRNRKSSTVSLTIHKDPNSQFGGILEFDEVVLGYQDNNNIGQFFLPFLPKVYFVDSAALFMQEVDIVSYFNYSVDEGVNLPSPTFSSPGEDAGSYGLLYTEYYPELIDWPVRNYTKYDIRLEHGITNEKFTTAHNDSLLIVSYDNVWGKKKYKWAMPGTFIPFETAAGKKGIIKVLEADTVSNGSIKFSMKIQL